MPTDQPRGDAAELNPGAGGLLGAAVPPPLEVEGGAPRGPSRNSPIDPGTPPTDADGATPTETGAEANDGAGRVGAPEPHSRAQ